MMKHRSIGNVFVTILSLSAAISATSVHAGDWPAWRGPANNGMAYEFAKVTSWSQAGDNILWKSPIGGRSTPVLIDGRIFFIAASGLDKMAGEQVVCLDANTGKTIWEHKFNVFLTTIVRQRIGWTAVVADPETKNIYAHGTGGQLFCLDFDGKIVWERSMTELYSRVSGYGGRLHTPVIDEDKVILSFVNSNWGNHGPPGHRYVAFDKRTGDIIWWAKPGGKHLDTTYSVPVVTVAGGKRQLVAANADGNVYGMQLRTGKTIWEFKLAKRGINSSIVADGNRVYVTHSEENHTTTKMGAVLCIDASKTGDITDDGAIWRVDGLTAGYTSPALANDRLYVVDNAATMHCFDAKTGVKYWTHECGRVGKGSPTVTADGIIYIGTVNGRFSILKDEGDTCRELHVAEFPMQDDFLDEIYGSPIVSNGRVYIQTRYGTFCLGSAAPDVKFALQPPMASEAETDQYQAATMLVVPGEITLAPGESLKFSTRMFDANGAPLDNQTQSASTKLDWKLAGIGGSVSSDGTFTADAAEEFQAGLVQATFNGVTASARVRISPRLPISIGFNEFGDARNPHGWVGLGKKTQLTNLDGEMVLQKLAPKTAPNVPFMRMRAYSGPPLKLAKGYTVECDMMGRKRPKGRMMLPDIGLINTRYTLKFMGKLGILRVESWSPMPRVREDVNLEMKPDVWYRAKLRVEPAGSTARVTGKVWPRDEAEPDAWTVTLIDPLPNVEGSPGLYAYSNGTKPKKDGPPVFFDNYRVYENK